MDELSELGELEAVRTYFDGRNCRVLLRLLWAFTVAGVVALITTLAEKMGWRAAMPIATLVVVRLLFWARDRPFFTKSFRSILLAYLSVQMLLVWGLYVEPGAPLHPLDFVLPWLLLLFRQPSGYTALPITLWWAVTVGRNLLEAALGATPLSYGLLIGESAVCLVVLAISGKLYRDRYGELLAQWRKENHRFRERIRMRGELDDARRIQLSMLPRTDPHLAWLDVAGISIPASEVGGDYYDYLRISETKQAIVVGDVAGHGVASGLLLSGVRSCLYLLKDTPLPPSEVLTRLDRMVRETTGRRVFVTLLYALFDQERMTVTVSSAAHPPLLHYRAATREVEEMVMPALPLGTGIPSHVEERTVTFDHDDIFLFISDGIAETTSSRGDFYGADRLRQRLRETSHDGSAREIRDTLLGDVWSFKGDAPQNDDITLVVVKAR